MQCQLGWVQLYPKVIRYSAWASNISEPAALYRIAWEFDWTWNVTFLIVTGPGFSFRKCLNSSRLKSKPVLIPLFSLLTNVLYAVVTAVTKDNYHPLDLVFMGGHWSSWSYWTLSQGPWQTPTRLQLMHSMCDLSTCLVLKKSFHMGRFGLGGWRDSDWFASCVAMLCDPLTKPTWMAELHIRKWKSALPSFMTRPHERRRHVLTRLPSDVNVDKVARRSKGTPLIVAGSVGSPREIRNGIAIHRGIGLIQSHSKP